MTKRNDISTPLGYFQDLQQRLQEIPAREQRPTAWQRVSPWLAYAASLAVLVSLGNFIFRKASTPAQEEEFDWAYTSYLASALDPDGLLMDLSETSAPEEEDIVNYLVDEDVPLEYLLYVNNPQ